MKREPNGRFLPGTGGRVVGSRNKLQGDVIARLLKHWQDIGHAAIDIVFKESPKDYLRIIAGILPKEYLVSDGEIDNMTDEEVSEALTIVRQMKEVRGATQQ